MRKIIILIGLLFSLSQAQPLTPVRIHYDGGGDWYGNKTTWHNILTRVKQVFRLNVANREVAHRITDPEFLKYPIAYIAGHGNIRFSSQEVEQLRRYLISGGFLYADDDFGMDASFRREMKRCSPN